ncbi:MAG: DUF1854 domain-containing protein [Armatimonadota bacterium]
MLTKTGHSSLELRYLEPEDLHVFRGEDGRVYATIKDEVTLISPAFLRSHPLTDPDRYISIKGTIPKEGMETRGDEFGLLRNWRKLDAESRRLVEEGLARRYLHPRLKRIVSLKDYSGVQVCIFETDRGVREVTLRDARDSAIYLGPNRVLITDAENNRYDIQDIESLDRQSRAYLARIL